MKKWNTPEVNELDINETANGKYSFFYESYLTHGCGSGDEHAGGHEATMPDEVEQTS